MEINFELKDSQTVLIKSEDRIIGKIFSPSGSGNDKKNAIQVCGFSEAFDLWGCGIFKGFKDIQLLFDGKEMDGKFHFDIVDGCVKCYRKPCQCEFSGDIPFIVKTGSQVLDRFEVRE